VTCFAGQLGVCLAELGPDYDSINERVIQAKNAAAPALRFAAHEGLAAECGQRDHASAKIVP
jgi:hypothetical protein